MKDLCHKVEYKSKAYTWNLDLLVPSLLNFSGLLYLFHFLAGVEAFTVLIGFPGKDRLNFFDVFAMKCTLVNCNACYDNVFLNLSING